MILDPAEFLGKAMLSETLAVDTEGVAIFGSECKATPFCKPSSPCRTGFDYRDGSGKGFGISLAYRDQFGDLCSGYFPIAHTVGTNVSGSVKDILFKLILHHRRLVFHNFKFDKVSLEGMGLKISSGVYCTMMMAHFIDENLPSKGLDYVAKRLGLEGKKKGNDWQFWHMAVGWSPDFPIEVMDIYASQDAEETLQIFELMYPEFVRQGFDG